MMMEQTLQVVEIAKAASEIMKNRPKEIDQKGNDSNFVTEADVAVQNYVTEELMRLLPGSEVLGEESETIPEDTENLWIVDPIDGTSNFIRDLGASVISIALMRNGRLFSGVIYDPYRDEVFYGEHGCGAWRNGIRVHVSDRDFRHSHLCAALSLYDKEYAETCMKIIGRVYPQADDIRRFGAAAYETAQLSAGRVELFFEMRISPWDVAAGALLIEEAGGFWECLYHKGMPIETKFPFIAANSRENFDTLRAIVTEEIPEIPYEHRLF